MVALLLTNTSALSGQPPTDGKFFYADFEAYEGFGLHRVILSVDSTAGRLEDFPVYVTPRETGIGLVDQDCKAA